MSNFSEQRVFGKYKASEIQNELQAFDVKRSKNSTQRKKNALKKIVSNLTLGNHGEMVKLFPDILDYWRIEDDMEVRTICHEFIRILGPLKPKDAKDALPFILRDLDSRNERLQLMALRTLVTVPLKDFYEEVFRFIDSCLKRSSHSIAITKEAIASLVQLDGTVHDRVLTYLDRLVDIVENTSDNRPGVKVAALKSLYDIHEKNKDMNFLRLTSKMAFSVLSVLPKLDEWETVYALECLTVSAVPESSAEANDMIAMVLSKLQHVNCSVCLNALKFIIYLLNYVDTIKESIMQRCSAAIITLLDKPPELQFLVLRNVTLLLLSRQDSILNLDVPYFFINYDDPIYIKDTKLECLYLLANDKNVHQILDELERYAIDVDSQMSKKTIRAIGNLAIKIGESAADHAVKILLRLLEFGSNSTSQEVISDFKNILRKYPNKFEKYVPTLVKHSAQIEKDIESKNAMIWIISQYYYTLSDYLTDFTYFSSNIKDEPIETQYSILNSCAQIFIREQSKETEKICLDILKKCTEDINNADLRTRAYMYWRLLTLIQDGSSQVTYEIAKEIIDGELPLIELDTRLDPHILQELELDIGSISSIYLKPASQIFRRNKSKYLPKSPALNGGRGTVEVVEDSNTREPITRNFSDISHESFESPIKQPSVQNYDNRADMKSSIKSKIKFGSKNSSLLSKKPNIMKKWRLPLNKD